ncbi:division/cell wall cluster transcriptional repressor MraZ [Sessilibacter sp. MAH2]
MFLGNQLINMDAKGRVAIPTRTRELLNDVCAGNIVLTAHTQDRCLLMYPKPQWDEILPKIEALPTFNKTARKAKLLMIGYASEFELDEGGRILIPPTLRDYAGLEKKVMLIGQGKNLELWGEEQFFERLDSESDDAMPEEMMSLSF